MDSPPQRPLANSTTLAELAGTEGVSRKRRLGSFYTQGNPFVYPGFREWFGQLPLTPVALEPFAGSKQISQLIAEAGYDVEWVYYDVDPAVPGVICQDTIEKFPTGFSVVITNPPWLSFHFAKRKKVPVTKEYFRGYSSLYLTAIDEALRGADFVAMIIPESFVTSGHFTDRLQHVISLPTRMFDDTEMPTALALWGPHPSPDFILWRQDHCLGSFNDLAVGLRPTPCASRIRFNVLDGQIGLKAIDSINTASIAFCLPEAIPAEKIKHSARLVSRIDVQDIADPLAVIQVANDVLNDWRTKTEDVLLTAFKGVRADGLFRRRLDWANARAILSQALCVAEGHEHQN